MNGFGMSRNFNWSNSLSLIQLFYEIESINQLNKWTWFNNDELIN